MLVVLALASGLEAGAQATEFGVRGGVSFQTLTGQDNNGNAFSNKLAPRLHAGVNVSIPVAPNFYVRPELLYAGKGTKSPAGNQYHLNYVEVPVNVIYKTPMGSGKLILGGGPYAAFGVGGKVAFASGGEDNVKFENNVTVMEANTAYYKQTDAGVNVLGGYEFGKMSLQLNAQLGLVNIYPAFNGVQGNASLKNSGVSLSVGYKL
ncbi:MAG: hypothetical protein K0Q66_1823 [Chitinophagaceae bacterium]|nr:hypothetical protein [Chitinophagaceae bacterium]